jgi:two-component system chemotaxis response regulator CheB
VSVVERVLRVLVVDDSAFVRKVVRDILSRSPFLEVVGTARNGQEALELAAQLEPDVIVCDLMMPEVDGLAFVRAQMARRPVPIIALSSVPEDEARVLSVLEAGAIDFVQKPTALANDRMFEMSAQLVAKVKAAASVPRDQLVAGDGHARAAVELPVPRAADTRVDVVVIGISTGGPQALRRLVPQLPAACPLPVVVVLHMPVGYTEMYARKLDELSPLTVAEAREGDRVEPGHVLIAPGGQHLSLHRSRAGVLAHLDTEMRGMPHRPSVDVLFRSAADVYGARVLAVVMSGMGADGREGAAWIKAKGGTVITQDAESCVVYGMPRAVVEAGLSDASVSLDRMARTILERI